MVRNFTKQEYNAESQNWSVIQDHKGFIYVANNAGLLEFDGVEWSFYPSPSGTVLRSVAVDENNRIYTSGYREIGFWERDQMGNLVYQSLNPAAETLYSQNEEFWNTIIIGDRVYFHSFTSVFIYDHESFRIIRPNALINSISEIDGKLCLHISGRGMFQAEDTILTPWLVQAEMRNSQVHFCEKFSDSTLLIGTTSEGMFTYKNNELTSFLSNWRSYFSEKQINRGTISNNGNIIIGTLLDGVLIFDRLGKLLHHINANSGLQNNTILGIHSNPENNIWLTMDKGVDFISFEQDPSYSLYTYDEIGAIYSSALYQGDLYVCTNQGVFYKDWESEESTFNMVPGTQGQAWSCGVYDEQLIVSHNVGTFVIDKHQANQISRVSGGFNTTRSPMQSNVLAQSTYSNIVFFESQDQNWQYKYQLVGFNDLIRYIELDHLNNIWASHMHRGVYRLKLNNKQDSILHTQYYGESVFGRDYDIQVFKVEGRIVFTTGEQIYTYSDLNDTIIPYVLLNSGLGDYAKVHRIIPGQDHHYWFVGTQGIGLFRIFDSIIEMIKEYPTGLFKDRLIEGYEFILPTTATEGLLCLENGYALLRADQPDLSFGIEDKQLILKNIEISGRSGKVEKLPLEGDVISIPFNRNSMLLRFAFPYITSQPIRFQSFVEELEMDWGEAQEVPVFNYARIPYGEYRIRIRAFNEWNIRSREEEITLIVSPPWYLQRVSFFIYLILLMLILLGGRYQLIRRIRIREQKKTETKEKELIRLRNEKLNAELSFKSQELANSTMAIIKKNEFLLKLKETIKKQKEDLGTRFPEKYYAQLVGKIDRSISSIDDWNVFEIHFEKAHEKFLQTLSTKYPQLSHSDLRLCAYLRMNLTSKEIAPLLRISYRGVENHRYRLRKKLHLKKEVNLIDFILSI